MYSIGFPEMFKSTKTILAQDHDATLSNLKLILKTSRTTLFGDPEYGNDLLRVIYSQNNVILQDLVIDEIYTCITTYIPQILINRNDISVYSKGTKLYADIKCSNVLDYTTDLYSIELTDTEE